jgi:hypothetical protein
VDDEWTRAEEPSAGRVASAAQSWASLCAPGHRDTASLFSYTQTTDDFAVMVGVSPAQVVQQTATLAYEFQQATSRVIVFCVCLEMLGQAVDTMGQQRYLNFWRTRIRRMLFVLADYVPLGFLS